MRILLIKPSALGDIATTLPLLCDLRAAWPDASIDWLIHPAYASVIEGHDALRQWIAFDRKRLASWWYNPASTRRFFGLLKTLRKNRYDIVIDAQGLFRSAFLARATGAKIRIGFASAREAAPIFYTHKVRLPGDGTHMLAVDRMRALSQPLGIAPLPTAQFRLPIDSAAALRATHLLNQNSELRTENFIAVIPGARWNTKRWPIDRYTALVRHLLDQKHPVLLLGSADERPLCDQIFSALSDPYSALANLAAKTDLPTLIALLSRARLVIANDSGPLHIAAALGTPVIALYGPTAPDFVGPFGQIDRVLRHDVPCHPCRRRECDHHSCMNGLTVELVWEKTRNSLQLRENSPA